MVSERARLAAELATSHTQNAAHVEIDADEFFALVEEGSLVRTEGTYEGTYIMAGKMFLRECLNNCL